MDERIKTLAYNLVHFSCKLEKGEKVWISCNGVHPLPLVKQIIKETYRVGAIRSRSAHSTAGEKQRIFYQYFLS